MARIDTKKWKTISKIIKSWKNNHSLKTITKTANESEMIYGLRTQKEWEELGLSIISDWADQLVADGEINPKGKSKLRLAKEAFKKIEKRRAQGMEISVMETHDDNLWGCPR